MAQVPMSKKYEKFDLNIEKLNSHAPDGTPRTKRKKNVFCSQVKVVVHSSHFIVYSKRLLLVFQTDSLHDMINKEIENINYPLIIYGILRRNQGRIWSFI